MRKIITLGIIAIAVISITPASLVRVAQPAYAHHCPSSEVVDGHGCKYDEKDAVGVYLVTAGIIVVGLAIWAIAVQDQPLTLQEEIHDNVWKDIQPTFSFDDETGEFKTGLKYTISY